MVGRVAIALLGASPTRDDACLDRGAYQAEVGLGLTGHDPAGRVAHVGAVKIEPNAPHQLGHVRLAEAGVGAARARGRAVEALVNAPQEEVAIEADGPRMPLDDFSNRHVSFVPPWHLGRRLALGTTPASLARRLPWWQGALRESPAQAHPVGCG